MSTHPADSEVTFKATWRMRLRDCLRTFRVAWSSLAAAPGLFLNVFLGLGGFLLALLSLALQYDNLPPWLSFLADLEFGELTLLLLVVSVSLLIISMVTTYLFAGPEQFAAAAVQGKSTRFILGFISWKIEKLCRKFTRWAEKANKLFVRGTRGELDAHRAARKIRRKVISKLTRKLHKNNKCLLRLMALKVAAAESLGVEERRLCDHILQFSPVMFEKGTRRYVSNWRLLEAALRNDRKWPSSLRIENVRNEIETITKSCRRRMWEQIRLRNMGDLHEDIVRFAASLSTSESLLEYTFTLAKAPSKEPRFWRFWLPTRKRRWALRTWNRLRFIHRKQRAHPGYDLHTLLLELCKEAKTGKRVQKGKDDGLAARRISLLKTIPKDRQEDWRVVYEKAPEAYRALATLPLVVVAHERTVGRQMANDLVKHCKGSKTVPRPTGLRFLVTVGYSRTVIRSIVRVLRKQKADRAFLIADREADQLSCRLMKTDLRMLCGEKEKKLLKSVAAGPSTMLLGMIQPGDRVTLVLGAEVFDKDRQVAHPRLLDDTLKRFIRCVKDEREATPELVVLAADYKRIDRRLAESRFYADHFDGVSILGPPIVSTILTESGPY